MEKYGCIKKSYIPWKHEQKETVVAILVSDKVHFRARNVRNNERHFIILKELIYQENIINLNLCVAHKYLQKHRNQN